MAQCILCNNQGWYFVDEWFLGMRGRRDCPCIQSTFKRSFLTAIVIASNEQLDAIGVKEPLNGLVVKVYDFNKYESTHGLSSMVRVDDQFSQPRQRGLNIDYIIPTNWLQIETK